MANVNPLEKQLIQCDLSKGINVRERVEVADGSKTFPVVENLIQDSSGAFVRRPGMQPYATAPWASGDGPASLIQSYGGGVGVLCRSGELYDLASGASPWTYKGQGPEFDLSAQTCFSSLASVNSVVLSLCSNAGYHVAVIRSTETSAYGPITRIAFYSRGTGSVVAEYDLASLSTSGALDKCGAVFVDNDSLHIWATDYSTDATSIGVVDTSVAFTTSTINPVGGGGAFFAIANPGFDPSTLLGFGGKSYGVVPGSSPGFGFYIASYQVSSGYAFSPNLGDFPKATAFDLPENRIKWVGQSSGGEVSLSLVSLVAETAHGLPFGAGKKISLVGDGVGFTYVLSELMTTYVTSRMRLFYSSIGSSTITDQNQYLEGWLQTSLPFATSSSGHRKVFVQASKYDPRAGACPSVVLAIKDIKSLDGKRIGVLANVISGDSTKVKKSFARVAVSLDPMLSRLQDYSTSALPLQTLIRVQPVKGVASTEFSLPVTFLPSSRSIACNVHTLKTGTSSASVATVDMGYSTYLMGPAPLGLSGGNHIRDLGFVDYPTMAGQVILAVPPAAQPAGTYSFLSVYGHISQNGTKTYSRVSPITVATTPGGSSFQYQVSTNSAGNNYPMNLVAETKSVEFIEVYRTANGQTQFYLVGSSELGTPERGLATAAIYTPATSVGGRQLYVLVDSMLDATLITQPLLFRQPGTPNSGLDRYPAPPGKVACSHKDRLFVTDAVGDRVYYSSFFVDGEGPWFNPAFSFYCHGGTGPITGLASMDGRLVVFKRDAVFVVDGDGPPEGGVSGNEFSPPQLLATPYGCVTRKSIQVTPEGLVFRSSRGIELLTRGLQAKWLGERVWALVDANPETRGSTFDDDNRYRMIVSPSADITNGICVGLQFDFANDCWTSSTFTSLTGGGAMVDIARGKPGADGKRVIYRATPSNVYANSTTSQDEAIIFGSAFETGWIKTAVQARQRISRAILLLQVQSNVRVLVSVAYDYSSNFSQVLVFEASVFAGLGLHEVELQLSRPECKAARFRIFQSQPLDLVTYPPGNCRMGDILGLAIEIAPKAGAPKLAADHKG